MSSLNTFKDLIKSDFKNYFKYNILQIVIMVSILFAGAMAFVPGIDALIFVYATVFILPVVIYAINIYIEMEEKTLLPMAACKCPSIILILSKVTSAMLLLLIPYVLYALVMTLVLNIHINILLFLLIYVLAGVMHIAIGIVLAMISKSTSIMSISYVAYIVIFSLIPFFHASGLIPKAFQYVMVISPAYLSEILFQEIYFGYAFSPTWLIVLSVILQIVYIVGLTYFIIRPYFKSYLILATSREGETDKL